MTARRGTCLVNGEHSAVLDVHDRGLHYGDGVFETIAVADGAALLWEQHLQRLQHGCRRLDIHAPEPELLRQEAGALLGGVRRGVLKLIVTRGPGGRGYRHDDRRSTTRVLELHPWPAHAGGTWRDGAVLGLCRTRLARQPLLAGIKHLNRLEQVLARSEWQDEWHDAVMLDDRDAVIEGTMSNLFLVRDGAVVTPRLAESGVAGVMRGMILTHGRVLRLDVREDRVGMTELEQADELFLTNSVIGLWPVVELNGRRRRAGDISLQLQEYIREQNWAVMD